MTIGQLLLLLLGGMYVYFLLVATFAKKEKREDAWFDFSLSSMMVAMPGLAIVGINCLNKNPDIENLRLGVLLIVVGLLGFGLGSWLSKRKKGGE